MAKRTRFLAIICMLSGLFASYGILSGLVSALSPPEVDSMFIDELLEQINRYELPIKDYSEDVESYYINLMVNFGNYGTAAFLFYSIQLIGVVLMYQLNRVGFALYVLAQIGLAAIPVLFGGLNEFSKLIFWATLSWNAVWIVMYATQLKYFRK
ncbi:MAG: hypothetical protein ABR574_12645 [Cryomorphaceae bacterium]|nr:hypothetical protein [Flavobacteriales bacterium]